MKLTTDILKTVTKSNFQKLIVVANIEQCESILLSLDGLSKFLDYAKRNELFPKLVKTIEEEHDINGYDGATHYDSLDTFVEYLHEFYSPNSDKHAEAYSALCHYIFNTEDVYTRILKLLECRLTDYMEMDDDWELSHDRPANDWTLEKLFSKGEGRWI